MKYLIRPSALQSEQVCYLLEGSAHVLVIYAPPYLEKPENVRRET